MSALRLRRPAMGRAGDQRLVWVAAAIASGAAIGLAVALSQTTYALLIVLIPLLVVMFLRLEWVPILVVITMFAEALSTGSVTLSRAVGPLAVLAMLLGLPGRSRVRLPRYGVLIAVIAYAGWATASVVWTVNPDNSFTLGGTGYALAQLGLSLAMMLAVVMFVRFARDLRRIMWTCWVMATVTGMISILQFLGGSDRSVGVSGDANLFAALQVVVLPLGALLAIEAKRGRDRFIILVGVAVAVGSIMTTLSRGGILALIAIFVLLIFQPARGFFRTPARKRAFLTVVLVGAGILLTASFSALSARTSQLFNGEDQGSGRADLWQAALTGWHQHELNGLGFGAFIGQSNQLLLETPGVNFSNYDLRSTGQYVHNAYLESLVELGIVGAVLFVTLLTTMALSFWRTAKLADAAGQPFLSAYARALLLALTGFVLTSIFLSTETDRTLWILVGLSVALPRVLREELQLDRAGASVPMVLAPQP